MLMKMVERRISEAVSYVALGRFEPNCKSFLVLFSIFVGIQVVYFNMFVKKHIHSFKL